MFIHKLYEHQKIYIFSAIQLFFLSQLAYFFAPFYALIYLQNSQTFLLLLNSYALNVFIHIQYFSLQTHKRDELWMKNFFIGNALCTYWYEIYFWYSNALHSSYCLMLLKNAEESAICSFISRQLLYFCIFPDFWAFSNWIQFLFQLTYIE